MSELALELMLEDLYPGSGMVMRTWRQWSRPRRATLLDP